MLMVNTLPNKKKKKKLDRSNLKAFADVEGSMAQLLKFFLKGGRKHCGKRRYHRLKLQY